MMVHNKSIISDREYLPGRNSISLHLLIYLLCIYECVCEGCACVEIRKQLVGVGFLSPPDGYQGSNLGGQA